jgi:hypothetical protein
VPCVHGPLTHGILGTEPNLICCVVIKVPYNIACVAPTNLFWVEGPRTRTILHVLDENTNTLLQFDADVSSVGFYSMTRICTNTESKITQDCKHHYIIN